LPRNWRSQERFSYDAQEPPEGGVDTRAAALALGSNLQRESQEPDVARLALNNGHAGAES